jgi:hypothetical protein
LESASLIAPNRMPKKLANEFDASWNLGVLALPENSI